jgi:outer membrane biosynthesis protein TonB
MRNSRHPDFGLSFSSALQLALAKQKEENSLESTLEHWAVEGDDEEASVEDAAVPVIKGAKTAVGVAAGSGHNDKIKSTKMQATQQFVRTSSRLAARSAVPTASQAGANAQPQGTESVVAPKEKPAAAPKKKPVVAPKEKPVAAPKEKPVAAPKEKPVVAPKEKPVAAPKKSAAALKKSTAPSTAQNATDTSASDQSGPTKAQTTSEPSRRSARQAARSSASAIPESDPLLEKEQPMEAKQAKKLRRHDSC